MAVACLPPGSANHCQYRSQATTARQGRPWRITRAARTSRGSTTTCSADASSKHTSALDLCVAEPERQAGEEERSGGPGGEHAEALPGGERQGADIGRGLDVQTRGHRGDLFQVPLPGPGADRGGEEREQEQQA